MVLDALEKERLRRKMADRMRSFLEGATSVQCVSGHWYEKPHHCELSGLTIDTEVLVLKNRSGKKLRVGFKAVLEMLRFQVVEIEDFDRWQKKVAEMKVEAQKRKEEAQVKRQEERKRLEKKIIIRKRATK